jgi:protein-glutamine gamma-glutamyltransferase
MTRGSGTALSRPRLLWSAGVVVGASVPHWWMLPAWMPAMLVLCAAWRIAAGHLGWRVPGRAVRMLLATLALIGVLAQYRTINGVTAGSALLVVMVALKLVEARTHRDELVLMIIAYFLVFASLLEHQSLPIALYLLAFVFVTTAGLLQLGRRGPLLDARVSAKLAGRMLVKALPVMIVLFVLFPRLPGPLWALPSTPSGGITGLSESMSPGDITELAMSEEIVFRVEFEDEAPPVEQLYWRGPVLAGFGGRAWTRTFTGRAASTAEIEYLGPAVEYRVMLEPSARTWAFALDMPKTWSEPGRLFLTSDYQLVSSARRDASARLDYRATSHTRFRIREELGERERRYLTHLPEDSNPRARALAESWRERESSEEAIIATGMAHFREEPFRYTLTPARLGRDAADEFLFETREGFCEHYASAFAVLMRAAGIPARVVMGYHGGELNAFGQYYIVRQSDAHAWTEVWLEGRGWVRVDPTAAIAPERIELGAASSGLAGSRAGLHGGWLRTARYAWDAINTHWYGSVVGFGQASQRDFLERIGFARATAGAMIAAAVTGVMLILAAFMSYRAFVGRIRRRRDPAARCFEVFVRRVARRRVAPRAAHETPSAFAERAARALPAEGPQIRAITAVYLRARYERDGDGAALQRLQRLVRGFRPRNADA